MSLLWYFCHFLYSISLQVLLLFDFFTINFWHNELKETRCMVIKKKKIVKSLHRVRLFVTPWTVAYQASPSMGYSRQEYWSGLPFPSPGDLSEPGTEHGSPTL